MKTESTSVPQQPPRLLPPHYFVLTLASIGFTLLLDGPRLLQAPWHWLGIAPLVLGVAIAARGSRQFARAGTNIVPFTEATSLVTDGVFARSRNPMYAGMLLALAGCALLVNDLWAWLPIAVFYGILRWGFIAREEAQMRATFGATYAQYCERVRRWF